jgi:hypothetical protein
MSIPSNKLEYRSKYDMSVSQHFFKPPHLPISEQNLLAGALVVQGSAEAQLCRQSNLLAEHTTTS